MDVNVGKQCIYCGGRAIRVKKGEHIVQEAIGGALTISEVCPERTVCRSCNNGPLSELDTELCSRSPLSLIAGDELSGFVWQSWDVDHGAGNLLVEAKPDFARGSMMVYPQMVFERSGVELRFDKDELAKLGSEQFQRVFIRRVREAFHTFRTGRRNRLNQKRMRMGESLLARYRYPPRIFARRSISDFARSMAFEFQYLTPADRRFALSQLDNWSDLTSFGSQRIGIGSSMPCVRCYFEVSKVLRAIAKQAINLLAAYCPNTAVDRSHFGHVIRVITGEAPFALDDLKTNGFVWPADVRSLGHPRAHSFRLQHDRGTWHVLSSYFGGRIGTSVIFRGPNNEDWRSAEIVAPLFSKNWEVRTSSLIQPCTARIEWRDPSRIIPSMRILNAAAQIRVEAAR